MLRENKVLTSLVLSGCELGQEGLHEVCDAVRMNTVLTTLDLSVNKFDAQSLATLGKLFITWIGHVNTVEAVVLCLCDHILARNK